MSNCRYVCARVTEKLAQIGYPMDMENEDHQDVKTALEQVIMYHHEKQPIPCPDRGWLMANLLAYEDDDPDHRAIGNTGDLADHILGNWQQRFAK